MLKKIAEELKQARKESGISLQQIHSKTRIDIKFLEALEDGNFEVLPEVYLRAFIREYSNLVGLDPLIELKRYDLAKAGKLIDETEIQETIKEKEELKQEKPKKIFTGAEGFGTSVPDEQSAKQVKVNPKLIFTASIFLIIVVLFYLFFIKGSSNEIITERPYDEILSENKQRFETTEEKLESKNPYEQVFSTKDSMILLIKSADTSWIGVKVDNNLNQQDFILYPSNQKKIKASKIYFVTIGNSKSVELLLNDKPLNFSGEYREVKFVKIDSKGLTYLTPIKTENNKND